MPLYYDNSGNATSEAERTFDHAAGLEQARGHHAGDLVPRRCQQRRRPALCEDQRHEGVVQWRRCQHGVSGLEAVEHRSCPVWQAEPQERQDAHHRRRQRLAGGTGTIFIDDIRLYATPPQVATATDPGTNGLVLLYAMEGNVQDSSGKGNHGTTSGDPGYLPRSARHGQGPAVRRDERPCGGARRLVASTLTSTTFAAWVNDSGIGGAWQRVFDFGTGETNYMFLTPSTGLGPPLCHPDSHRG